MAFSLTNNAENNQEAEELLRIFRERVVEVTDRGELSRISTNAILVTREIFSGFFGSKGGDYYVEQIHELSEFQKRKIENEDMAKMFIRNFESDISELTSFKEITDIAVRYGERYQKMFEITYRDGKRDSTHNVYDILVEPMERRLKEISGAENFEWPKFPQHVQFTSGSGSVIEADATSITEAEPIVEMEITYITGETEVIQSERGVAQIDGWKKKYIKEVKLTIFSADKDEADKN